MMALCVIRVMLLPVSTESPVRAFTRRLAASLRLKAFSEAKVRLAPALSMPERSELARKLAGAVVAAAAPLPVIVVCEDDDVAGWAADRGAAVARKPGAGLNGAIQSAAWGCARAGYSRVTVAHGDIPDPGGLSEVGTSHGEHDIVLVPDRHRDGTNVVSIPVGVIRPPGDPNGFTFRYGPGSFSRHHNEALRLGTGIHVLFDTGLSVDIDLPDDLEFVGWKR